MGRNRRYAPEFREEAVRLAEASGAPIGRIATELGMPKATLTAWVAEARATRRPGPASVVVTGDERAELLELRRRVRVLETEREILKKAAAFFASETDRTR